MGNSKTKIINLIMLLTINSTLKKVASERYYIKNDSSENVKINTSIKAVKTYLNQYFKTNIIGAYTFGSFERDTILPREIDQNSDVDILIIFDHENLQRTPETYRKWILEFANSKYQRTNSMKDFPTVVIEMNHLKLDLVPAVLENSRVYIPDSGNNWQITDPVGFNKRLTEANKTYGFIVKPMIRILKAWNCTHGYPYASFELEKIIAEMNFTGDNYETGFFYAIDQLPFNNLSQVSSDKVQALKNCKKWLVDYMERGDKSKADEWLGKILP
jgi:predicted nucleotidyltransferase